MMFKNYNRNIVLLWLGQIFSQSGDSIYQIGLLWLVLELSGSEVITGLVVMASYMPAVLLSIFAGVVADKRNRKRIMLIADLSRFVTILIIPILHILGYLTPIFLAVNAFALSVAATFFNPARDAIVPQIVKKHVLTSANSLIQTSWQFSLLIGPALAGLLLHLVGNVQMFSVTSLMFLFSFICIILMQVKPDHHKLTEQIRLSEIKDGFLFVVRHKVIRPLLLITVADNLFIMGPAIVGTPVLVKIEYGLGAESYALIMGCYAVGMLLGTIALMLWGNRFSMGKLMLLGMVLDGATFIPIYWADNNTTLAIIIIIHSLAIPLLTVNRTSIIQCLVPSEMTGRVFAFVNISVIGMTAISSGIAGIVISLIGVKALFFYIGIGGALCGVIGWFYAHELRDLKD